MDFSLSEEQKLLRETIVKFARNELNHNLIERDREGAFSLDLWKKCAQIGILGLPVSEEYGGSGLDALSCAMALEAFGYGCKDGGLTFSLSAHLLACVMPVWIHGTVQQKEKYLKGLCDGTLVGAHAITEPGSGSDTFSMRTKAERVAEGWKINGTKTFISNGPCADVSVIFAVTDADKGFHGGVTSFLVENTTPGYHAGKKFEKLGLRTSPVGELVFQDMVVSDENVLGTVGGGSAAFATAMDWERVLLVAGHIGIMERLLETSIAHVRTRIQFNQAIGKFQAISHKIADMKVMLEAARLLAYHAAWKLNHARSVSLDAAITKLFVSESLVKSAMDAVQIHGGYGFMVEYEIERALRDAIGSTIYSGTSEMQRNIIARWLGL